MDKELKEMFNHFDITEDEIDWVVQICPGLNIVDYSKARQCVINLIKAGYPKDDIGEYICINPSFMMYDPERLKVILTQIGGDISAKLKNDPFII